MSELKQPRHPAFVAGDDDPSRAAAVSAGEFDHLRHEMDFILLPLLQNAASLLDGAGFSTVRTDCRDGSASLFVQCAATGVEAWLRFQVHRSFAVLVPAERIFWMYSVCKAGHLVAGKPGRLKDFIDTQALSTVISDFILDCLGNT